MTPASPPLWIGLLAALSGCAGAFLTETGDTASVDPNAAPEVLEADVWCYEGTSWAAAVTFLDVQGADTVESIVEDGVVASREGEDLAVYSLVCGGDGRCSGAWDASADGVLCEEAAAYSFTIRVLDVDGHWSEPLVVTGRQGTDASGRVQPGVDDEICLPAEHPPLLPARVHPARGGL